MIAWRSSKSSERWWRSPALSFGCMLLPWKTHLFSGIRLEQKVLKGASLQKTLEAYQSMRPEIEVRQRVISYDNSIRCQIYHVYLLLAGT